MYTYICLTKKQFISLLKLVSRFNGQLRDVILQNHMKKILSYVGLLFAFVFSLVGLSANTALAFAPGDVVINEFKLTTGSQWVEIINNTASDINLASSTWELVTTVQGPGAGTTTLTGLLPAYGLLTFTPNTLATSTYHTLLSLNNASTPIYAMSYGSSTPFASEATLTAFPTSTQSAVLTGTPPGTWSATTTITRGWYNEGPAPTLASLVATINAGGIATNMGTATDTSAITGLYFEKRTDVSSSTTALGRMTFAGPINLTNASTTAILQALGTKMQAAAGRMAFDARTATDLKNAGASISMYNINSIGYNVSNLSTSTMTVKDDVGAILSGGSLPTFSSISTSSANGGTFTFTTSHFTEFGFNPNLAEVTPIATTTASTSPYYTFSSNVAGTAVFGGACATTSAATTIGNNIVRFGPLTSATYSNCTVKVTDGAGASSTLAVRSFIVISSSQTEPVAGVATISTTTPEVVITDPIATTTLTINSGVTNPTIDVSYFIGSNGTGTIPAIIIDSPVADITIEASTLVTSASTTWDGVMSAPIVSTITLPNPTGETRTFSAGIELGLSGVELTFDKAVKIVLPNQAGKRVGYTRDAGVTFTEIINTCTSNTAAGIGSNSDCKIDASPDLVIWTKHFTTFASYSQTTNTTTSSRSSGGSAERKIIALATVSSTTPVIASPSMTISQFVQLLISIGAIKPDMVPLFKIIFDLI